MNGSTGYPSRINYRRFATFFVGGVVGALAFYFLYAWLFRFEFRYWEISLNNPWLYVLLVVVGNLVYAYYKSKIMQSNKP